MKGIRELLKDLREDNDLKQSEVAELIGTTQQQYSKYETGETELPLRALIILAERYNVSADYLLGRTECKDGVAALNDKFVDEVTVGALLSDALSLDTKSKRSVLEYIHLQQLKLKDRPNEKNDA